MSNESDGKTQQVLSDYIKSLPEPSAGMKLIAEAGATYIRHRLGLPPKDARYVLARFIKPFIQAKWFGMGGREIGVASFEDIEEKWSTALYDIPEKVDPFEVLLLRFEPIKDTPAFDAGRCFTWSIGTDEVAVCQVLSAQVMEVFKSTDPFTSRRIVGFARLDLPAAQPDAVSEKGIGITYKTREPIPAREPNQLQVYQQLTFPTLDDVKGIEPGELFVVGAPPRAPRATFGEQLHQDLENARAEEDKAAFAAITKPQSMLKCGSEECAEAFARERGQLYGHSVLDGCWYVGDAKQLTDIGVFVCRDETQDVTPELINQVMTNTSTLPTISKEERALLEAVEKLIEVLDSEGVGGPEYRVYRKAEANFLATRKEF